MNYLAHLHIAEHTNTSYIGNLLGDFVKGGVQYLPYDDEIKHGVNLHRAVDVFTDQHKFVRELKASLGDYRRYGGIVLDVLFDHQLACNFDKYSKRPLSQFSKNTYPKLALEPYINQGVEFPERFHRVVNGMTASDWLIGYREEKNIERALHGISMRLKRPVDLTQVMPWYQNHQSLFEQGFEPFYRSLLLKAESFNSGLSKA
ncbi:MAG: DUF479 domain-containing protein [Gammaproteobacteria bacterium]|nr:DUF479 domain-containing protein [Gammaproteobacteria bacterium]